MKEEDLRNIFRSAKQTLRSEAIPSASPQWLSKVMNEVYSIAERESESELWNQGMWRVSFVSLIFALVLFPFAPEYKSIDESELTASSSTLSAEGDLDPLGYENVFGVSL